MLTAHFGRILHFIDSPHDHPHDQSDSSDHIKTQYIEQYIEQGALLIQEGLIKSVTTQEAVLKGKFGDVNNSEAVEIIDHRNHLILPGFIDAHIHYPQTRMISSYGEQLLDWLNRYTFPEEAKFADKDYARAVADQCLDLLLKNGTTTALTFCTVHPQSVDALFESAQARNMRMIAGKVMMDRHAPAALLETAEASYRACKRLIERWHNVDRFHYAVTPRFAPTSTESLLAVAKRLLQEHPDLYLQTHLAENRDELKWVAELFPDRKSYLDVYDHYGLLTNRSVLAHAIHLSDAEWSCLSDRGASIAFCPCSNQFLGSGLFELNRAEQAAIPVALGTDIGAGTTFSLLGTARSAYETQQLRGYPFSPYKALYMATLGGAKALQLDDKIGNFTTGKEADFVVLDTSQPALLGMRVEGDPSLTEELFALCQLGDDRSVMSTYVMGKKINANGSPRY